MEFQQFLLPTAIEHLLEECMDYLIISNYVISAKDNENLIKKIKSILN